MLAGDVDLAVHSAKDVPGRLPDGLVIAAVPTGEDPRDALVGTASAARRLPAGARVGTSSLRRRSQLLAINRRSHVLPLRGNVDTRLRKLAEGEYDAMVLALAGLRRLGRDDGGERPARGDRFVPAPGQGAACARDPSGRRSGDAGQRARGPGRALPARGRARGRRGAGRAATRRSARMRASMPIEITLHAFVGPAGRHGVDHRPAANARRRFAGRRSRARPAAAHRAEPPSCCAARRRVRSAHECPGEGIVYLVGAGPGDPRPRHRARARADRGAPT